MPQLACAVSQSREHRVTVRNGFVSWRLDSTGDLLCRLNCPFSHAVILARHFRITLFPKEIETRRTFGELPKG
jgi:hypothetical protein